MDGEPDSRAEPSRPARELARPSRMLSRLASRVKSVCAFRCKPVFSLARASRKHVVRVFGCICAKSSEEAEDIC
ncbi:hypothetical protein L596_011013 [Steinernema carpocapsae]|uniref:Uncharacterized protein n=1 Tax=Steinernema carpocapsae TaxID=34508 RepID=A0A4U5NS12_STECR|nr:hypothetical protein L596_011013 [Steinernema carpocapsae]